MRRIPIGTLTKTFSMAALLAISLSGCMSNGKSTQSSTSNISSSGVVGTAASNALMSMELPIPAPSSPSQSVSTLSFYLTMSSPIYNVPAFCGSGGSITCYCEYQWNLSFAHSTSTSVTAVTGNTVSCTVPDGSDFTNAADFPNGLSITISVLTTSDQLVAQGVYTIGGGGGSSSGGTVDDAGTTLKNISRYSCYEEFQRPNQIVSYEGEFTFNSATFYVPYATEFCYFTMNSSSLISGTGGGSGGRCDPSLSGTQAYSTQSFYYSLYTASDSITANNSRYYCPTVNNPVSSDWPMDSTYSLAVTPDSTFTQGVVAPSVLGNSSDPSTAPQGCPVPGSTPAPTPAGGTGSASLSNAISYQCLGYAAPTNLATGTCPTISIGGELYNTYRLRRYYALYPATFDTNGAVVTQATAIDTVYVLDRPTGGTDTQGNAETILGPKPCPFAYYDQYQVTGANQYYGTNNTAWAGKNLDNIQFPNQDYYIPGPTGSGCDSILGCGGATNSYSCSALIPLVTRAGSTACVKNAQGQCTTSNIALDTMDFATVNVTNTYNPKSYVPGFQFPSMKTLYVRPVQPWAPHYVEDTGFQACAPQSFAPVDPPLYFVTNANGQTSWCAATEPTAPWSGVSFSDRPSGFTARTMTDYNSPLYTSGFATPPVLAPAADIYNALINDSSYNCSYSESGGTVNSTPANCGCANTPASESTTYNGNSVNYGYQEANSTSPHSCISVLQGTPEAVRFHPNKVN